MSVLSVIKKGNIMKYTLAIILTSLIFCENPVKNHTLPKMKTNIQGSNLFSVDYLGYEQSATVEFDILEDGSVSNVEIIKFPNTKFLNNFMDDIYSLEFSPAKIDNKPVVVRYQLPISFVKI